MDTFKASKIQEWKLKKAEMQKRRTVSLNYKVCACTVKNSVLNDLDENGACIVHCISTTII